MAADDAKELLAMHGERTIADLRRFLQTQSQMPAHLGEAISYALLAGGKRLRPTLVLESFAACSGAPADQHSAVAGAGALELIHTFSLVHDDLPAMDDDNLRRGKPTCHVVFGQAMAILAGDAMVCLAFELLASEADPAVAVPMIAELAAASGPAGMIGGQVLDIAGENQKLVLDQLQQVHRLKTGALLTAACRLGALAARATGVQLRALTDFGRHIGLAFQIVDDVLDVTSSPEELGKQTNKDAGRGKNTYPELLGLEQSKAAAAEQLHAGLACLNALGTPAQGLRELARFVVERAI